jgi:tetratricopeptide (TPR) repeat protein
MKTASYRSPFQRFVVWACLPGIVLTVGAAERTSTAKVVALRSERSVQEGSGLGRAGGETPTTPTPPSGRRTPKASRPLVARTPSGVSMPLGRSAAFYLEEGLNLLAQEDYASAEMFFDEGIKVASRGKKGDALASLQQAKQETEWFAMAIQYETVGNAADAVEYYDKILAVQPANAIARRRAAAQLKIQGDAALKRSDWNEAVKLLERAEKLGSTPETRVSLVDSLLGLGGSQASSNVAAARDAYTRALSFDPRNAKAMAALRAFDVADRLREADALLKEKKFTEAEKAYSTLLVMDPGNAEATRGRTIAVAELEKAEAETAFKARDYRKAQVIYERIQPTLPDDAMIPMRLEELKVRLAPMSAMRGTLQYSLRVGSPFRIRIRRDQVVSALLNSEMKIEPKFSLSEPPPFQNCVFKLTKVSANATARIAAQPGASNNFTTEIVVEPKSGTAEEIQLNAEWSAPTKGLARWRATVGAGNYRIRWQGPYFEILPVSASEAVNTISLTQDPLPHRPAAIKLKNVGAFSARIVSAPSAENDFTLTVEVDVPKPGSIDLVVSWMTGK